MRVPSRLRLFPLLAAVAICWVPALSQTKERTWELGGTLTFTNTDSQTSIENGFGASLVAGYTFTPRHGAEAVLTRWSATQDKGPPLDIQISILRLGYTYNAHPREKVISFFRAGVGVYDLDVEELEDQDDVPMRLQDDETHALIYGGGGVRFLLNNWLAIRAAGSLEAINSGTGLSQSDVTGSGDVGIVFLLGGREAAPRDKEDETPPEEESKPEGEEKKDDSGEEKPPGGAGGHRR